MPPLTPTQRRELLALLAAGIDRDAAARYVGLAPLELLRHELHDAELAEELARAERNFELAQLRKLGALAEKHWNAAAWLLERRFPERYAKRTGDMSRAEFRQACEQMIDVILEIIPEPPRRESIEFTLRQHLERPPARELSHDSA